MSSYPEPKPGMVIHYSYLWLRESQQGHEEGRKDRPCVITHTIQKDDKTTCYIAPITHTPNSKGVEIPAQTKQRLGLDDERSWIVTDEVNRFKWLGYDVRPVPGRKETAYSYGFLPQKTRLQVQQQVAENVRTRIVSRDEPTPKSTAHDIKKRASGRLQEMQQAKEIRRQQGIDKGIKD